MLKGYPLIQVQKMGRAYIGKTWQLHVIQSIQNSFGIIFVPRLTRFMNKIAFCSRIQIDFQESSGVVCIRFDFGNWIRTFCPMDCLLGLQHIAWLLRVPWRRAVHSRFHSRAWRPVSRHLAVGFAWPTLLPGARCWRDGPRRSAGGQSCFKIWRFVRRLARQKAVIRGRSARSCPKVAVAAAIFHILFFQAFRHARLFV